MSAVVAGLRERAGAFESRTRTLAIGRSLLAIAQLTVVLFTSDRGMFPPFPDQPPGPRCDGLRSMSLWCVGGAVDHSLTLPRLLTVAVLLVVAAGYRPRWTCVPHWYATAGLHAGLYLPNGGDQVATVITLLLIPICLGDRRRWQWSSPTPMTPAWRGSAHAAHLVLRVQVALVYGHAVLGKLLDPVWRDGTAVHFVLQDADFGAPLGLLAATGPLSGWLAATATWGTIVLELVIAVSMFGPPRVRLWGLFAGLALHGAIAIVLGLPSFAAVMIGMLCVACAGTTACAPQRPVR